MTALTPTLIWGLGFAASLSAVHLCAVWRDAAADQVDFDRPVIRSLTLLLGWAAFALCAIFSATLDGFLRPAASAAILWALLVALRRTDVFHRLHGFAPVFAAIGFLSALYLFQIVFGDSDFGLFSVFPPD